MIDWLRCPECDEGTLNEVAGWLVCGTCQEAIETAAEAWDAAVARTLASLEAEAAEEDEAV